MRRKLITNHFSTFTKGLVAMFMIAAFCVPLSSYGQDPDSIPNLEERVAALFARSCTAAGCHSGPVPMMGLDLTSDKFYATAVDEASTERPELKIVDPGNSKVSYMIHKLKGQEGIVGMQMPFTGEKLTTEEIGVIEEWIDSLDDVDTERKAKSMSEVAYPFYGWKVVNLPTTRLLNAGDMLFLISHRFNPKINDGYDAFFGLDGSGIIYISLGYAITDRLMVAVGRSNSDDDVQLQARYGIAHQGGEGGWPVGVSAQTSFNWVSQDIPDRDRFGVERFKTTMQVSVTRQIGDKIGLAFVPGLLINPGHEVDGESQLVTLGLGGRYRFSRTLSVVADWAPIVSGFTRTLVFGNDIRFDTFGGGLEIATAGHVFQIILTNSVGITSDQYLRGGDLDITKAHLRLGFNIFRVLN
ncbi:MAG: hypothetical protein HKN43_13210 [Rhodothermales bacterium]|nr:hypothetical protein [Rhodothermales bacterium]